MYLHEFYYSFSFVKPDHLLLAELEEFRYKTVIKSLSWFWIEDKYAIKVTLKGQAVFTTGKKYGEDTDNSKTKQTNKQTRDHSPAGTIVSSVGVNGRIFWITFRQIKNVNFNFSKYFSHKLSYDIGMFALCYTASLQWASLSLLFLLQPHQYRQDTSKCSHKHHAQKQRFTHCAADHVITSQWTIGDWGKQSKT